MVYTPNEKGPEMTDYKNCTSRPIQQPQPAESWLESIATGVAFLACLAASWAVLALVSFN
jgi:hypothetical protein